MLTTTSLLALREIRRHLLRSFLTTLGIVIGVFSVVTLVTLGISASASVAEQIKNLGSNILTIRAGQGPGRGGGGPPPQEFKLADVNAIRNQIAGITSAAPQAEGTGTAVFNSLSWSTTINGTNDDYLTGQAWAITAGRPFTAAEQDGGKSVCIIGMTLKSNLFRDIDPIGQRMRIKDISCDVVGLLAKRGSGGFGNDQDDVVIMPIKTFHRRLSGDQSVRGIQLSVDPAYDSKVVQTDLKKLLRERRNIASDAADDFNIFDSAVIVSALASATSVLTGLLAAVAGVSLLVGGIGIMNIMLVSVTERTREIGIRLAIGAVAHEVLMQFLVEAVAISCLGGILGLILSAIIVAVASHLMGIAYLFSVKINLLTFLFTALIGVVFGYFPARRAASLNPIDALRHE